jgi:UPF0755 protein
MRRPLLFSLLTVALLGGLLSASLFLPLSSGQVQSFAVRPGENASRIALRLVEKGTMPAWSKTSFVALARMTGLSQRLRPGVYHMPTQASPWRLVHILGEAKTTGIRVTLPEGRTCWDLAGILQRASLMDSLEFAPACTDSSVARRLGIPAPHLEGFLFPDTYLFDGSERPIDVARTMHQRFLEVLNEVKDTTSPVWQAHGYLGTITLASIVEREAAVRSEAPLIAGAFWLRLQQGITLGADPTVRYALRKFTGSLTKTDLAIASPYNTRVYPGLPPGPIANPGKAALQATMKPDTREGYLYFVGKDDGSREHYFGRTLNEHVRYKNLAAKNRSQTGIMAP